MVFCWGSRGMSPKSEDRLRTDLSPTINPRDSNPRPLGRLSSGTQDLRLYSRRPVPAGQVCPTEGVVLGPLLYESDSSHTTSRSFALVHWGPDGVWHVDRPRRLVNGSFPGMREQHIAAVTLRTVRPWTTSRASCASVATSLWHADLCMKEGRFHPTPTAPIPIARKRLPPPPARPTAFPTAI